MEKGDMQNWAGRVEFTKGNAETLEEIASESIDLYTIAFGIRNVTNIDRVLKSAYRVLKPGGVFACLVLDVSQNTLTSRNSRNQQTRYLLPFIIVIRSHFYH